MPLHCNFSVHHGPLPQRAILASAIRSFPSLVVGLSASRGVFGQIVQRLLEKGANVNAQGGYYGNALQVASYEDHVQIVQRLLKNGADFNAQGGRLVMR